MYYMRCECRHFCTDSSAVYAGDVRSDQPRLHSRVCRRQTLLQSTICFLLSYKSKSRIGSVTSYYYYSLLRQMCNMSTSIYRHYYCQ